jgi:hypothetical protein
VQSAGIGAVARTGGINGFFSRHGNPFASRCGLDHSKETLIYFFEKQKDGFFATLRMTKA